MVVQPGGHAMAHASVGTYEIVRVSYELQYLLILLESEAIL